VNRHELERGVCRSGDKVRISSYGPHHGEESPIRGHFGSGTIFLTSCNLRCVFCQNFDISHEDRGRIHSNEECADIMIALQEMGCHNINWVTPTHYVPSLIDSLLIAARRGLRIPIVYNSSAFDSLEVIRMLDGIIDIYMPDFKFWDAERSRRYLAAPKYPEIAREVLSEMHRQVGELKFNESGVAVKGLLVRHLVMPGAIDDTRLIMKFIADEISPKTYVNIMNQYRPCGLAGDYPEIDRVTTIREYNNALAAALDAGLTRLDDCNWGHYTS
jgi:putative pyruvate formate lyase activating enzyme